MTPILRKLPKLAPPPHPRFCQDEEQQERYVELALRVYRKHNPATPAEVVLTNDILISTWLLHFWKIRCSHLRKNFRALRADQPQAAELEDLKADWDRGERQVGNQTYYLARRRKIFTELREEYLRRLGEAGYSLEEARAAFLGEGEGAAEGLAEAA